MQSEAYQFEHIKSPEESWHWYAVASLVCHVFLIAMVLFFPFPSISMPDFSDHNVIEVDLEPLSPPPQTPLPPDAAAELQQNAPPQPDTKADEAFVPEPEDVPPAEPHEPVIPIKKAPEKQFDPSDYRVVKPGPKIKASMKNKTLNTAAVHRSAIEKLRKESEKSRPQSVKERIDQLNTEVDRQDRKLSDHQVAVKTQGGKGRGMPSDMTQMEIYQATVAVKLKNNWVFSEKLAGQTQGLESRWVITIKPDGSITDLWYEKLSGNKYLDDSAKRTIEKSDPLPPLPEGYKEYHLMVGFTPSGLKRSSNQN